MNIVLFEDHQVDRLSPITLMRPAYAVTCGALRLVDLAQRLQGGLQGVVRSYLSEFQVDYFPPAGLDDAAPTLWLNARLVPDASLLPTLRARIAAREPFRVLRDDSVAVALTRQHVPLERDPVLGFLASQTLPAAELDVRLLNYPHDVLAEHSRIMGGNLEYLLSEGGYSEIADGVFSKADLGCTSQLAFNTAEGPIVIDEGVQIGSFTEIHGPMLLGPKVRISPNSHLKGWVSVGHTTKLGGEVAKVIIEPYSNKVHFGYLGSSYVGSWVNLGAGTTNSNLKNTYGTIRVEYGDQKVDTGQQFFGCVIGDYTKTAIHTAIYTGKMIGVCSNVYGTVTTNVPSFANYARSFGDITEQPAEVMQVTQRRVFARRGIQQEPRHLELLRAVYELEAPKRKLANNPPSL